MLKQSTTLENVVKNAIITCVLQVEVEWCARYRVTSFKQYQSELKGLPYNLMCTPN